MNPFFICMFVSSINWNDIQNMLWGPFFAELQWRYSFMFIYLFKHLLIQQSQHITHTNYDDKYTMRHRQLSSPQLRSRGQISACYCCQMMWRISCIQLVLCSAEQRINVDFLTDPFIHLVDLALSHLCNHFSVISDAWVFGSHTWLNYKGAHCSTLRGLLFHFRLYESSLREFIWAAATLRNLQNVL